MNRTLLFVLSATLWPTVAHAVVGPTTAITNPGQRQMADGHVVERAKAHMWRASAPTPRRARAWKTLATEMGSAWATWDDLGQHPRQIIGNGVPTPGVMASAVVAERVATELLARHLPLLAPGTAPTDFVIVANHEANGIRSVGFAQHSAGREVVGGQIGLVFTNDRLVMITSLAQRDAGIPLGSIRVDDADARNQARAWIDTDFRPATSSTPGPVEGPLVLPVGDATSGPQYREVVRTEVESEFPMSRFTVYLDAQTGEPVARESRLHNATGQVFYNVAERSPILGRAERTARFTEHIVNGVPQVSNGAGVVTFPGASTTVEPGLRGPFIEIIDDASDLAQGSLTLPSGGGVSWNRADDPLEDAQLTTFSHLEVVKTHIRNIDPSLEWLDQTILATVNLPDECNAMSDGDSVFFLQGGDNCENTGRMSDVVYHEVGHSVHNQSLIPGVGSFDGALSEGISDYLAATIVSDPGIGRGFFYTEDPLRDLDPRGFEWIWPQDNGEVHAAGLIIGGALWDLRTLLIEKYGPTEGIRRTDVIYYESTRRAVDMPSMYGAALIVNDDDGDLENGTPDACEINEAFGAHGLFSAGPDGERVSTQELPAGLQIRVDLSIPNFPDCPLEASAFVEWRPRDGGGPTQTEEMTLSGGTYFAVIPPLPPGEVMLYRVGVAYSTGTIRHVPANLGDPWFQYWFGEVEPIWCTSFEAGTDDWALDGPWEIGEPQGRGGDPSEAAGEDPFVLGLSLGGNGQYGQWSTERVDGPAIAIPNTYASVRLHYQRWLTVEDGFYDQAHIYVDDEQAWSNFASDQDFTANIHHRDSQWVFHDVDISPWAADGNVRLSFEIASDGGLEFGGWNVDELCVVGYSRIDTPAVCGDSIRSATEQCDDGNQVDGDGCSAQCTTEERTDDDGGADEDDGGVVDTGLVDEGAGFVDRGCACHAGGERDLPIGWGLLVWLVVARRRRQA